MNRMRQFIAAAIFTVGFLGGGLFFSSLRADRSVTPEAEAAVESPPQRWEYCVVTKAAYVGGRAGVYWITYYRDSGVRVVDVEDNATTNAAAAKAVARLGDEGWEMVGPGPMEVRGTKLDGLYFKRPKP